jgi:Cytochrome P460
MPLRYALFLACILSAAEPSAPRFTSDNELVRPDDYREWVFLSSGLGMTYGPNAAPASDPRFDNVFVHPQAYRSFRETGKWPDGTIFALEVRSSASKGSIND